MPLVKVDNWGLPEEKLAVLVNSLPEIVSYALKVGGLGCEGFLTKDDIEVVVRRGDPLDIHGEREFGINIEAAHFPEREERLPTAILQIKREVLDIVRGHNGYVWVTLPVADFAEIHHKE
jgi:hypothetical protein